MWMDKRRKTSYKICEWIKEEKPLRYAQADGTSWIYSNKSGNRKDRHGMGMAMAVKKGKNEILAKPRNANKNLSIICKQKHHLTRKRSMQTKIWVWCY